MSKKKTVKRIYNVVVVALLVLAIAYVMSRFVHPGRVEWTDDAQVHRHITSINTRVQGYIQEIRFTDFQQVHRGDTLVVIEDAEWRLQEEQAQANVAGQQSGQQAVSAGIGTTQSNVAAAGAGVDVAGTGVAVAGAGIAQCQAAASEARVAMQNARADYDRYAALLKKDAVTRQQYDQMKTRYDEAAARYQAAQAALAQARARATEAQARQTQARAGQRATATVENEQRQRVAQSRAGVTAARAQLGMARLHRSYTVIIATCDGFMGRKDIHVGQLVQPGQELAKIVDATDLWVTANYRETQLHHIAPGAQVTFKADALPDVTFKGTVQAISEATGSAYSSVPVDNATGNFVKVEQRVPVRIVLAPGNKPADVARLRAGLNVETEVKY